MAEAAALLGWGKQRVSEYLKRGKLPEPVERLKSGPVWLKSDIEQLKGKYPKGPKDTGLKYQDDTPIKQGDVVKITNLPGGRSSIEKLKEEVK